MKRSSTWFRSVRVLFFLISIACFVTSIDAQVYDYRPGSPYWPYPHPYPVPVPPGAVPSYYYYNIPIYDTYDPRPKYVSPLNNAAMPKNLNNKAGRVERDRSSVPRRVTVIPRVGPNRVEEPIKPNEQAAAKTEQSRKTWKTQSGEVFEDARIFGMMDGQLGLQTPDGKRHYIWPNDLDEESRKAFDLWKQHKKK